MVAPASPTETEGRMSELKRLVLDYRTGELVVRCLYRTEGGAGPNTKARTREVSGLVRTGLAQALGALEGAAAVEVVGTSGFTTREDILSLPRPDEVSEAQAAS
jgi:hypothetical protein